jgi:hypothetical protein
MKSAARKDDGCAEIGQETVRKWCMKNNIVMDQIIAADLVAYVASAVRGDRALRGNEKPTASIEPPTLDAHGSEICKPEEVKP